MSRRLRLRWQGKSPSRQRQGDKQDGRTKTLSHENPPVNEDFKAACMSMYPFKIYGGPNKKQARLNRARPKG